MKQPKRIKVIAGHEILRASEGSTPLSRLLAVCTLPLAALASTDCSGGSSPDRARVDGTAGHVAAAGDSNAASGGAPNGDTQNAAANAGTSSGGTLSSGEAGTNQTGGASGSNQATGGSSGSAGNGSGGNVTQAGRAGAGGASPSGGASPNGGATSGGGNGGRRATGGRSAAGAGGSTTGTAGQGGGGTNGTLPFSYYIGADITDQETQPDATRDNLLTILEAHGFNYIRLRTFVDPKAADGYDQQNGYDDITHTVAFGKQIKDAGMGLLLDFHYSDNWADPGKQCVPIAWQSYTTIADLATAVHDYTKDAITKLIAGGARPDMVQIGNEITPGMLIHRCDSSGHPTGENPITGKVSNWTNLGALLKAGAQGVKEVDASIVVAIHIDQGDGLATSKSFITNAQTQGVAFDAFGESCYTAYQGQPSGWQNTFDSLATQFPSLKLYIAEYGPEERAANDIIFGLANDQGIGTFNWEPTTQGDWNTGHDLLRRSGSTYTAQPDLALYDQMKIDYASRL